MKMKNDCQSDHIKEAFDKLYNCVMPYIDLTQFADARTAFQELDKKVHSEIYILKKVNIELRNDNEALANTVEQYKKTFLAHCKGGDRIREVIGTLENEINDIKKKIHELEQETADDAIRIKSLERSNSILRGDNETLWSRLEEADLDISKRPWHGDGNAMTGERTCYKSLSETIEFQNKKIEELEAEKARLKEVYDIHETTTKKENVDLSPGHEFEFGDEVFVPWSCDPYMYIKSGQLYNPRTERLVYVGKDQHLKWFGEKFTIV